MSLEHKIKEWEAENDLTFTWLKNKLGEEEFHFNNHNSHSRCFLRDSFEFKYQKCNKCKYLYSNLSGKKSVKIPKGKRKGRSITIIDEAEKDIYVNRDDVKELNIEIGNKIHQFYKDEFYSVTNINWYATSSYLTNISLILMVLRLYSIKKNFPIYLDYLTFYNCTGTNFMIHIEQEYESIEDFNKDPNFNVSYSPLAQQRDVANFSIIVIKDILFQSFMALKFYESLFFTHNELDWSKLRFSNHSVTIALDGEEEFVSSFKCYIFPSTYSAISIYDSEKNWWGRYFHTREGKKLVKSEKIPFSDFIIEMNGTESYYTQDPFKIGMFLVEEKKDHYLKHRIYFYRFNHSMDYFINLRREKGSVFCLHSFDAVTLFCSLMTLPYFSEPILDNDHLFRVWLGLWRKDEAHTITGILTSQKKPLLFDDICVILKKFYIRFDALNYLYKNLLWR